MEDDQISTLKALVELYGNPRESTMAKTIKWLCNYGHLDGIITANEYVSIRSNFNNLALPQQMLVFQQIGLS